MNKLYNSNYIKHVYSWIYKQVLKPLSSSSCSQHTHTTHIHNCSMLIGSIYPVSQESISKCIRCSSDSGEQLDDYIYDNAVVLKLGMYNAIRAIPETETWYLVAECRVPDTEMSLFEEFGECYDGIWDVGQSLHQKEVHAIKDMHTRWPRVLPWQRWSNHRPGLPECNYRRRISFSVKKRKWKRSSFGYYRPVHSNDEQ